MAFLAGISEFIIFHDMLLQYQPIRRGFNLASKTPHFLWESNICSKIYKMNTTPTSATQMGVWGLRKLLFGRSSAEFVSIETKQIQIRRFKNCFLQIKLLTGKCIVVCETIVRMILCYTKIKLFLGDEACCSRGKNLFENTKGILQTQYFFYNWNSHLQNLPILNSMPNNSNHIFKCKGQFN